jgi:hypothetical protein
MTSNSSLGSMIRKCACRAPSASTDVAAVVLVTLMECGVLICNPLSGGHNSYTCVGLDDASSNLPPRTVHQAEKRITALRGPSSRRRNLSIAVTSSMLNNFFRQRGASSLSTEEKIGLAIGVLGLVAALFWLFQNRSKTTDSSSE